MKKPEILAPAGDFVCLQAAIDAGADAVYFGLGTFNMRARSGVNFKVEDLPEIARRCGTKVKRYLTLNAIMFESELEKVEETIVAAKPYVDAFIVSDWGVISLLKRHGCEVHVSTQMSTSNSMGVGFLASQGVTRVVLARECSLAEIRSIISKVGIEIECFVHGAQCVAESGRCFMSHSIFGKSACRGECNQPCRRQYLIKAVDFYAKEDGTPVHDAKAEFLLEPHTVMSAKDVCSLGFIDKLMEAGIASFKIEGRARNANYVKTTVECYRAAVRADHGLHVLGVAGASLDLEARDARRHQLVDEAERTEVLRGEDGMRLHDEGGVGFMDRLPVLVFVEIDRLHEEPPPTGLMTLAATGALAEDVMAHEAAPRLGDALRAMDEALDLDRSDLRDDRPDFVKRAFARQNDPGRALGGEKLHRLRIRRRHLGRDVELDAVPSAKRDDPPVGDDEGVDPGLRGDDQPLDLLRLVLEHDRVQGQIGLNDPLTTASRDFGKIGLGEVDSAPGAHVERAEAEVDGVGAGVDRGLQTGEISCRGKDLWLVHAHPLSAT